MRQPGVTCAMIGLCKTGRRVKTCVPKTDPDPRPRGMAVSAAGLLLPYAGVTRPARERFSAGPEGDALFAAHLEEMGERIRAEMRNKESALAYVAGKAPFRPWLYRDGKRISWLDLRTLRCAGCRRSLLGPSDECIRVEQRRRGPRGRKALAALPPLVAGSVHERPVCAACLMAHTNRLASKGA